MEELVLQTPGSSLGAGMCKVHFGCALAALHSALQRRWMWPGCLWPAALLCFLCAAGEIKVEGNQGGHHMVQCMMVINLRVMNVQARILASFKGNLAAGQVLAGAGPWV